MMGTFSGGIIFRTMASLNSGLYLFTFTAPPECPSNNTLNHSDQATSIMTPGDIEKLYRHLILLEREPIFEQSFADIDDMPVEECPFSLFTVAERGFDS